MHVHLRLTKRSHYTTTYIHATTTSDLISRPVRLDKESTQLGVKQSLSLSFSLHLPPSLVLARECKTTTPDSSDKALIDFNCFSRRASYRSVNNVSSEPRPLCFFLYAFCMRLRGGTAVERQSGDDGPLTGRTLQ